MRIICLALLLVLVTLTFAPAALAQQDLYDCADFQYQEDAQAVYDQDTSDPYGLDGPPGESYAGEQGVACEELPSKGTSSEPSGEGSATCDDFISVAGSRSQYQAQQYFDFYATPEEKAVLDTDGDGFACDGWSTGVDTLGTQGGEEGYWGSDGSFYYW
jgi:hypothetical protein